MHQVRFHLFTPVETKASRLCWHLLHRRDFRKDQVRERGMRKFKSVGQPQTFLSAPAAASNLFNLGRHLIRAEHYRNLRVSAFEEWGRAVSWSCTAGFCGRNQLTCLNRFCIIVSVSLKPEEQHNGRNNNVRIHNKSGIGYRCVVLGKHLIDMPKASADCKYPYR